MQLFLAGIYREDPSRTSLKPGDSSRSAGQRIERKIQKYPRGPFAIPYEAGERKREKERDPGVTAERNRENEGEDGPSIRTESRTPPRMAHNEGGESDAVKRAAVGREREKRREIPHTHPPGIPWPPRVATLQETGKNNPLILSLDLTTH
jgi:hypothetical protein